MREKNGEKEIIIEKAMWQHCSIHNIEYPRGSSCPECSRGGR